jgi:hypothetical protein
MHRPQWEPLYRKPPEICRISPDLELISEPEEIHDFVRRAVRNMDQRVASMGLRFCMAGYEDIEALDRFQRDCFPPETPTLETLYELYRIVMYGHALLGVTAEGEIAAAYTEITYNDPDKTSWGVRVGVKPAYNGRNLGAMMATYTALVAMEKGAYIRRAFMSPENFGSVFNVLNHVGYLCDAFYRALPGFGIRFRIALPLTPAGLRNNRVDPARAAHFVATHEEGRDYLLLDPRDTDRLEYCYAHTGFRVAACLNTAKAGPRFLAFPKDRLGLP